MATIASQSSQEERKLTKVAIQFADQPANPLLVSLDKTLPIREFVSDIVRQYNLERPEEYVLSIGPKRASDPIVTVNDQNRHEIIEGTIMHLVKSPEIYVKEVMETLSKEKETVTLNIALKELHERYLMWPEFVYVFVSKQGHIKLLDLLKSGNCSAFVPTICYQAGLHLNILMSIRVLFLNYGLPTSKNGLVSWQLIDEAVIKWFIHGMRHGEVNTQTLECCYDLLDNCIQLLPEKASWIVSEITKEKIFYRLKNEEIWKSTPDSVKNMQHCLVNFLNTVFRKAKADGKQRETVCAILDTEARDILRKCIRALRDESVEVKNPFLEALVTLQQHLLCPAAIRAATAFDPSNETETLAKLIECIVCPPQTRGSIIMDPNSEQTMASLNLIRSLVQQGELSNRMANYRYGPAEAAQFRALGFQNDTLPHLDFDIGHGGMLAFDCVMYFAQNCPKETEELLYGKAFQDCERVPFVHASTVVTRVLGGRFRLIEDVRRPIDETDFFPVMFSEDKPFEKVFCKALVAFARTWRDMRATSNDMDIVRKVFTEQLNYTAAEGTCRQRLQTLVDGLQKNSYAEVVRRQRQREEEQKKSTILSQEIRRGLKPRIDQLIVDNRLRHMERGDNFHLVEFSLMGGRTKEARSLLLRLSPNHKELYYETCTDERMTWKQSDEMDDKPKISLTNIQSITYGPNCAHAANKKLGPAQSNQSISLSVAIPNESSSVINICARSQETFNMWMDGLNYLRKNESRSSLHSRDFETLFDLEVKVRSLHLPAGLDVTQVPPLPPRPVTLPGMSQ